MLFDPESTHAFLTLLILGATIYGFVSEKLPPDVTALLALLALLVTGILKPIEAFAGFGHPATVSVAAVLVLSAGLARTGALTFLARRVLLPLGKSEILLTAVVMATVGILSAFINNTAAVAIFMPVVLEVCRRTGLGAGRVLMPMAYSATLGGMCTLIGTSTNLVAHEYARSKGMSGFGMFEIGQVGVPMLLVGFAYILLVGRWFLPHGPREETKVPERSVPYVSELIVLAKSRWIGRKITPDQLQRIFEVTLVDVTRKDEKIILNQGDQFYEEGDRLHVRGSLDLVLALAVEEGLELHRPKPSPLPVESATAAHTVSNQKLALAEVVILPSSDLIGQTLKEAGFAEQFDAVVLAVHRPDEEVLERPSETRIHAGDVLVLEGLSDSLKAIAEKRGFLVIGAPAYPEVSRGKLGIAVVTLAAVVTVAAVGLLPIVTAATAGCVILMLARCLRPRQAYHAIDWSIIFLLAGMLAMGTALEKTGVTNAISNGLQQLTGFTGPFWVLVAFLFISSLLSEMISNSATAALLAPVAVSSAVQMGINPMSLLAAVALGSSASFATPVGYQTNLMIYGAGGYRFKDYLKMGIPINILLLLLGMWLIPLFWPLEVR